MWDTRFNLSNLDLNDVTMKKLYRSLSLIVFVNIGMLLIFFIGCLIIIGVSLENQETLSAKSWFIITYCGIIYAVGSASNAPTLFINK